MYLRRIVRILDHCPALHPCRLQHKFAYTTIRVYAFVYYSRYKCRAASGPRAGATDSLVDRVAGEVATELHETFLSPEAFLFFSGDKGDVPAARRHCRHDTGVSGDLRAQE